MNIFSKENSKSITLILAVISLASSFILNWGKVNISFLGSEGFTLINMANEYFIFWLLVLMPVIIIAVYLLEDSVEQIKAYKKYLVLALPVLAFVLEVIFYFVAKGKFANDFFGVAKLSIGFGFILQLVCYLLMTVFALVSSKDVDLGNDQLNKFVGSMAEKSQELTEKAVNTASKEIDKIKK